ncbi:hypothetical protein E8E14_007704 [Neopestalotiopsis sp. 37M]|nr:hypothetical protein E8E14_007704 [Neopestalotiopsis sp. 37M]
MAVALIATGCLLKGWKTGVSSSPWNLMAMSQLSRHPELQYLLCNIHEQNGKVQPSEISKLFEDNRYTFGWWNDRGSLTYGALVLDQHGASSKLMRRERPDGSSLENGGTSAPPKRPRMPTFILTVVGRLLILFLLIGLSIHISIYPGLRHTNDGFADFVDSESIGKGVENPKSANKVGEFDPSTNPFSALARTVWGRQSDLYLGMVAVMSIMSEFLPTLLANVPHRVIETYIAHFICMWLSVGLLILMALTIIGSFFVKWPHMPIDPTTLIGAMYYVVPRTPLTSLPREV